MRPQRKREQQAGVTLVELMIALAVFSIGVLGLLRLTLASIDGGGVASHLSHATTLAAGKLDELVMQRFDSSLLTAGNYTEATNLGAGGTIYRSAGVLAGALGTPNGAYIRAWTIADQDVNASTPGNDFKVITVSVSWHDGNAGRQRTVTLVGGKSAQ